MRKKIEKNWSMKNFLIQWQLKKKTERCTWLPNPEGYIEEELKDLYIGEKPLNLVENWGDQLIKNCCCAQSFNLDF